MKRLLEVRITRWPVKLAYVLSAYAIGIPFAWLIPDRVLGEPISTVLTLVAAWYGTRVFRGHGEPVAPKRAWWRMTAWRRASGWIGGLSLYGVMSYVYQIAHPASHSGDHSRAFSIGDGMSLLTLAILAFFYLNSWLQLYRIPTPPRAVNDETLLKSPARPVK
ncbi:MAG: hypothetical protein EPN91_12365 [Salinibacterium sp.]|nr:MAG: hypothetical protein EPN91_12365 [Salinibacterium sp.]